MQRSRASADHQLIRCWTLAGVAGHVLELDKLRNEQPEEIEEGILAAAVQAGSYRDLSPNRLVGSSGNFLGWALASRTQPEGRSLEGVYKNILTN